MKIYICTGYGVWLNNATVIIAASCMQEAKRLLHGWGVVNKIDISTFDITLAKATQPGILFEYDGDY